jgi:hypothetical protein
MRRVAYLIGSPEVPGQKKLPGVDVDLASYRSFLKSDHGGAWDENEIRVRRHPKKWEVLVEFASLAKDFDYSLVLFTGHGHHYKELNQTHLCLTDKDEISVLELNTKVLRQLTIIDACRQLVSSRLDEEERMYKYAAFAAKSVSLGYRQSCRALYDQHIMDAPEGRSIIYSCDINQTSGETATTGGHFSSSFVSTAEVWGEAHKRWGGNGASNVLDIPGAFALTEKAMQVYAPQRPVLEDGRRSKSFAVAVA